MSLLRRIIVVGAGTALLLGASAGPLSAASKSYLVSVSPSVLPFTGTSPQSSSLSFTFTNTTPSASINSVTLAVPTTGNYTITGLAAVPVTESSGNAGNYSATFTPSMITVTNLRPLGYQESVTLFFSASIDTGKLTCQNNASAWVPTAYNGSNLSGSVFTPTNSATTTIGTALKVGASINVNGGTVTNTGSTCALITVTQGANHITIFKPSVSGLKVDILWAPEAAPAPGQSTAPTEVDTPGGLHNIYWCDGTAVPWAPVLPNSTEVSCLVSESTQAYGPDPAKASQQDVQVHDVIFVQGDWTAQH